MEEPSLNFRCRICDSTNAGKTFKIREMMFGFGDEFAYTFCQDCGTLSQEGGLEYEMAKYYPANYYSYEKQPPLRAKTKYALRLARHLPGWLIRRLWKVRDSYSMQSLSNIRAELKSWLGSRPAKGLRILDVGCGSGEHLKLWHYAGHRVEGLDPFYTGANPKEFPVHRCQLEELQEGEYDVITFQYSLEHLPEPSRTLHSAYKHLSPDGVCVAKLPKLPCAAFTEYGANWVNLDAPRHFFIPSAQGVIGAAKKIGFREVLVQEILDRKEFVWSAGYQRGIPMVKLDLARDFTEEELSSLYERAFQAKESGLSGHACFIMHKAGPTTAS